MALDSADLLPDFVDEEIPQDSAPNDFEYACNTCGTEIFYGGRGRKPKYCDKHKSGAGGTTGNKRQVKSSTRNNGLALQAAAALTQVNGLLAMGLMVAPGPFRLPVTASALSAAEEGFNDAAYNALITDPKLCALILKGGGSSGKLALLIAYGMLAGAVVPIALTEYKENASGVRTDENRT